MTNSRETEAEKWFRLCQHMTTHAEEYKKLFHDLQEKLIEREKELFTQRSIMRKQTATIRKMEISLGIDQEL